VAAASDRDIADTAVRGAASRGDAWLRHCAGVMRGSMQASIAPVFISTHGGGLHQAEMT